MLTLGFYHVGADLFLRQHTQLPITDDKLIA
eukprot:COSAG05_NODE_424_length_9929_cov_25.816378_4_plen_31_part_00